tara:strand:- start:4645 stop:5487 length:843 start_codon:yes stop_codon:yes gene_type:complete
MAVDSPSRVRTVLDELGIRPEKRLGQNFLCDGNWIRKAVEALPPEAPVVEVGPGIGALTTVTLDKGHEVWAVEIDPRLCRYLERTFTGQHFHLLEGDAVSFPVAHFPAKNGEYTLLSNLPFAITSPWIDKLLSPANPLPKTLALILQKEGMDRTLASPASKAYGPTAIRMALSYDLQSCDAVPRSSFFPQPTIESRFGVWIRQNDPRLLDAEDVALLRRFFGQRRKMIRQGMKQWLTEEVLQHWVELLAEQGMDSTARAESISPELWWNLLKASSPKSSR